MQPSIGRIVHYTLSREDAARITDRRRQQQPLAFGNPVSEGDAFPAVIVRLWDDDTVNLRVWLDGTDDLWATSRPVGDYIPGTWSWPART